MSVRKMGGFVHLTDALRSLSGLTAKVGWFEDAQYTDGTPVAYVAAIQEFGYAPGGLPPRPFIRPTVGAESPKWLGNLADGAAAVLRDEYTAAAVLELVARSAADDIAIAITKVMSPPLAAATIARKGFAKPLVDTGTMFKTVTGVVERGKQEIARFTPNADATPPR